MYDEKTTLKKLLENKKVQQFLNKTAPEMTKAPINEFIKGMNIRQILKEVDDDKRRMLQAILDVANGKEVSIDLMDVKKQLPKIEGNGEFVYDIDDVDGPMCMLERRFSGCVVVRFSKMMDESVYGKVSYKGKELPKGLIKKIDIAGGMQMLGIPVCEICKEYDTEYQILIEGFRDIYGNYMNPQTVIVKTLPKRMPDPQYAEHDNVALEVAREGIVLLKNADDTLPLSPNSEICVVGASMFRISPIGAGRINPRYSIRFERAIDEFSSFKQSEDADIGVVVISRASGENFDNNAIKGEFYLTDEEEKQIAYMANKYKKIIAIINSGYPIDLCWVERYKVQAVVWCGFPGMLGGKALVEILDGRINPSAKLPDTWSNDYFDIPASANFYRSKDSESALSGDAPYFINTCYEEDIYVGYRYFETFDKSVAYPFGFGLSYTKFDIDAVLEGLNISVAVKNIGNVAGKEVVQVYVSIPDGKLEQPSKRLVGFVKTYLLVPGELQKSIIKIDKDDLASYDADTARWIMERGRYEFYVGNSIKNLRKCGEFVLETDEVIRQVENLMRPPLALNTLSKENSEFPKGLYSGIREGATGLMPKSVRKHYAETDEKINDFVNKLSVEELARLSVCASHGWGIDGKGEAGKIYRLEKYDIPYFTVADGNNGVNINKPNIGMPCSNIVCATFNTDLAYEVGRVIAEEARENDIHLILGPGMNIHRNPLNGRHPEYFSEDPYLAGIMAGYQSKGLEENGVSSCIKHVTANNCEAARKRNHSIITERALREIYLKVFEIAIRINKPDSMMTAYNAVNGVFAAEDEEMIQGIFRKEFGFDGFVMTDWSSYDTADIVSAVQAGNCWMTPGSTDNTYVMPIIEGAKNGRIDLERLKNNVRYILRVVQKRTGKDLGIL